MATNRRLLNEGKGPLRDLDAERKKANELEAAALTNTLLYGNAYNPLQRKSILKKDLVTGDVRIQTPKETKETDTALQKIGNEQKQREEAKNSGTNVSKIKWKQSVVDHSTNNDTSAYTDFTDSVIKNTRESRKTEYDHNKKLEDTRKERSDYFRLKSGWKSENSPKDAVNVDAYTSYDSTKPISKDDVITAGNELAEKIRKGTATDDDYRKYVNTEALYGEGLYNAFNDRISVTGRSYGVVSDDDIWKSQEEYEAEANALYGDINALFEKFARGEATDAELNAMGARKKKFDEREKVYFSDEWSRRGTIESAETLKRRRDEAKKAYDKTYVFESDGPIAQSKGYYPTGTVEEKTYNEAEEKYKRAFAADSYKKIEDTYDEYKKEMTASGYKFNGVMENGGQVSYGNTYSDFVSKMYNQNASEGEDYHVDELRDYGTEEQKAVFTYLYQTKGREAALKYSLEINPIIAEQAHKANKKKYEDSGDWGRLGMGISDSFMGGLAGDFIYNMEGVGRLLTGDTSYHFQNVAQQKANAVSEAEENPVAKFSMAALRTTGAQIPMIITSMATGGASGVLGNTSSVLFFASAAGSSYSESINKGNGWFESVGYGTTVAAFELLTEKIFDVPGIYGGSKVDDAVKGALSKGIGRLSTGGKTKSALTFAGYLGVNALGEGFEEGVAELFSPVWSNLWLGEQNEMFTEEHWKEIGYASLLGSASALLMGGLTMLNIYSEAKGNTAVWSVLNGKAKSVSEIDAVLNNESSKKLFEKVIGIELSDNTDVARMQVAAVSSAVSAWYAKNSGKKVSDLMKTLTVSDAGSVAEFVEKAAEVIPEPDAEYVAKETAAVAEMTEIANKELKKTTVDEKAVPETAAGGIKIDKDGSIVLPTAEEEWDAAVERSNLQNDEASGSEAVEDVVQGIISDVKSGGSGNVGARRIDNTRTLPKGEVNAESTAAVERVLRGYGVESDFEAVSSDARARALFYGKTGVLLSDNPVEAYSQVKAYADTNGKSLRADSDGSVSFNNDGTVTLPTAAEELDSIKARSNATSGNVTYDVSDASASWTSLETTEITGRECGVSEENIGIAVRLSKALGLKIVFFNRPARNGIIQNGFYNHETGVIYINAASGNPVARIIAHELTHSLEKTQLYGQIKQLIIDRINQTDSFTARKEERIALYAEEGTYLTNEKAESEVIADYIENNLLTDEAAINGIVKEHRRFGEFILSKIERIIEKVRGKSPEGVFLRKVQKLYKAALDEVAGKELARKSAEGYRGAVEGDEALQTLAERFRNGEISKDEFLRLSKESASDDTDVLAYYGSADIQPYKESTEVSYSLSNNVITDVKKVITNKNVGGDIKLTDSTPSIILSHKGVRNLPMYMKASHIRENVLTEEEAKKMGLPINDSINYHGLGETLFLDVIDDLDNVNEAYRGTKNAEIPERNNNYFLLISKYVDKKGNIINVPVFINEHGRQNNVYIDINKISTVFGRDSLREYLKRQVALGNLIRIKKRSPQASEAASPINADYSKQTSHRSSQTSEPSSTSNDNYEVKTSNAIISKDSDFVNNQILKNNNQSSSLSRVETKERDKLYNKAVRDENKANLYSYRTLTSKPDMPITYMMHISDIQMSVYRNDRNAFAKAMVRGAAEFEHNPKNTDTQTYIHNNDAHKDILVTRDSIKHGAARIDSSYAQICENIGSIIRNAVAINELEARNPDNENALLMIGMAENKDNYVFVRMVINNQTWNLKSFDVLYAIQKTSIKKEDVGVKPPGSADYGISETSSKISIADLLENVKSENLFAGVLSDDVKHHLNISPDTKSINIDGVVYSLSRVSSASQTKDKLYNKAVRDEERAINKAIREKEAAEEKEQRARIRAAKREADSENKALEAASRLYRFKERHPLVAENNKLMSELKELKKNEGEKKELTTAEVLSLYNKRTERFKDAELLRMALSEKNRELYDRILRMRSENSYDRLIDFETEELSYAEGDGYDVFDIDRVLEAASAELEFRIAAQHIVNYKADIRKKTNEEVDPFSDLAQIKDKPVGFYFDREAPFRNIRDVFKDKELVRRAVEYFVKPVQEANGDIERMKIASRTLIKKLGLNKKESRAVQYLGEKAVDLSAEEREWLISTYKKEHPKVDMNKVTDAIDVFRKIYNELLEMINEVRIRNGLDPVMYRKNYFPHFSDDASDTLLARMCRGLGINPNIHEAPTEISGRQNQVKPKSIWFGHLLQREGSDTVYDAIEGFERYIETAADIIHHTDNIRRIRAWGNRIRYNSSDKAIRKQLDAIEKDYTIDEQTREMRLKHESQSKMDSSSNASHLVVWIDKWADSVSNRKSAGDREIEYQMGKKAYAVAKKMQGRNAASLVAGKLSTALTNIIPLSDVIATVKARSLARGCWESFRAIVCRETGRDYESIKHSDGLQYVSNFLVNRTGSKPLNRGASEYAADFLTWGMETVDKFISGAIWRANYYESLERLMSENEAIKAADKKTRKQLEQLVSASAKKKRKAYGKVEKSDADLVSALAPRAASEADLDTAAVMADRGKGMMPVIFDKKNPLAKLITQFQIEPNNSYSYYAKDLPELSKRQGKSFLMTIAKILLAHFLLSELWEYLFGRKPLLDPLGILIDFGGDLTGYEVLNLYDIIGSIGSEDFKLVEKKGSEGILGSSATLVGNVAEQLPFTSALSLLGIDFDGGRVPISSMMPDISKLVSTFESDADPKKKGYVAYKELGKLGWNLALGPAGGLAKNMTEGIYATTQGGSYTVDNEGDRELQYPMYNDSFGNAAGNIMWSTAFGKSTTSGGKEWVKGGFKNFGAKYTTAYEEMSEIPGVSQKEAYEFLDGLRSIKDDDKSDDVSVNDLKRKYIADSSLDDGAKGIAYYHVLANDKEKELMFGYRDSEDFGEVYSVLSGFKDFGNRVQPKRELLLESVLDGDVKRDIYESIIVSSDDKEKEIERLDAFESAGLGIDDYLECRNYKYELEENDNLNASGRATEFARWVDNSFTSRQAAVIKDALKFSSGYSVVADTYERYRGAGLSPDEAYELIGGFGELEPLDGKEQVSDWQKARVIVDGGLSDEDKLTSLDLVLDDGPYNRMRVAYDKDIELEWYLDVRDEFYRLQAGYGTDKDKKDAHAESWNKQHGITKGDDKLSFNQVIMAEAIENIGGTLTLSKTGEVVTAPKYFFTKKDKAVLWQVIEGEWSHGRNPFDTKVGLEVRKAMGWVE